MIVDKVHLENWSIIREPFEIEFSDGLNILHGPNDIGKTMFVDSIRTVFFTKHTSHSKKVRSLVPWGSSLSPKATITFSQNGSSYRITERFMSSEMSLLEKLVSGEWERIAEGDEADKKIIELVGGKLPIKGDTKPEYWGIGQALWMVQGEPFISEDLNEETFSSLQKLIGATIESDQEKKMFMKVNERFSSTFTTARRDIKKGSEISNLNETIEKLEEKKRGADGARKEKEELIRRMDENEIILERKKKNLKASLAEKEELKEKVKLAHEHRENRARLEEEIKRLDTEYGTLQEQTDSIKEGKKKIEGIELESRSLNERKDKRQTTLEELQGRIEKSSGEIDKVTEEIDLKDQMLSYTRIAYDAIQKERELSEKEKLLTEVVELEKDLSEKQRNVERLKAPSKEEMKGLELSSQRIHDLRTKLDTIGLTTKIAAESDISGTIHLDEKRTDFKIEKGKSDTWTSRQTVKMHIGEVGDFEIRSGSEDVGELRTNLEELEIEYEEAVAPYPTKDIEKLRESSLRKEELEKEIKKLEKNLQKRAKGGRETISREVAGLKKKVESNWGKVPDDSESKRYMDYKDREVARQELSQKTKELEKELKGLKKERKSLGKTHSKLEEEREEVRNKIQELDKKINSNEGRMNEIRATLEKLQKDGLSLDEREKKLDKMSSELDKKERALKVYKEEIEEVEEKPLRAWEECETKAKRFQEDIHRIEKGIAEMNVRLNIILDSLKDINRIEEELEYLRKRESQVSTDARAVELVYDLMRLYRGKTIESLTMPIQQMMAEDLTTLFGEKYTQVKFDEGMKPILVEVPTWEIDASIDVLSFGTKEQMWYLFRLALGRLLSSEERQLVVLDDPLAHTDPSRMHRALQVLQDRASQLQIIVITCDVDKYNWLSDASFIPFER